MTPRVGYVHVLSVVSRSGRASAELMRVDLDDDERALGAIAAEAASTAYSAISEPERHAALADALKAAVELLERTPGQNAQVEHALEDGRRARASRHIAFPE